MNQSVLYYFNFLANNYYFCSKSCFEYDSTQVHAYLVSLENSILSISKVTFIHAFDIDIFDDAFTE